MSEITYTRAVKQLGLLCRKSETLNTFVRHNPQILVEFQKYVDDQSPDKYSHIKSELVYEWLNELGVGATVTTGQIQDKVGYLGGAATAFVRKAVREGTLKGLRRGHYKIVSLEESE